MQAILNSHFDRYPAIQIQDIYKLIYQGCLGAEHAVASPVSARARLEKEIVEMGNLPLEPIVDPISPDGEIIRIHLRPYLDAGGDVEILLAAFIRTANDFRGKISLLKKEWDLATRTSFLPAPVMNTFIRKMEESNYPAVHHSEIYKERYSPAYRIVWRKYFSYQDVGDR